MPRSVPLTSLAVPRESHTGRLQRQLPGDCRARHRGLLEEARLGKTRGPELLRYLLLQLWRQRRGESWPLTSPHPPQQKPNSHWELCPFSISYTPLPGPTPGSCCEQNKPAHSRYRAQLCPRGAGPLQKLPAPWRATQYLNWELLAPGHRCYRSSSWSTGERRARCCHQRALQVHIVFEKGVPPP